MEQWEIDNIKREKKIADNQRKVAIDLGMMVNSFDRNYTSFIEGIQREHRSLQQSVGGVVFVMIKDYAAKYNDPEMRNRYFDGRNEQFGEMCSEIDAHMSTAHYADWDKLSCI